MSLIRKLKNKYVLIWFLIKQITFWAQLRIKILTINAKRFFSPTFIPDLVDGRINLHLGCGNIDKKDFINVDGFPYPHVHYVQPIDKLSNFSNDSIDLIYACHCLEHFRYLETKRVLSEWYRVLKKGGVLRLSVPDFDKLVEIYMKHKNDPDIILPQLMGGQDNKYNYHFTVFNYFNLVNYLKSVGFSNIKEWVPGSDELTSFDDFSIYKKEVEGKFYEISLNVEAIK